MAAQSRQLRVGSLVGQRPLRLDVSFDGVRCIIPRVTNYTYDANGNNTAISNSMSPHLVGSDSAVSSSSGISLTLPPGSAPGDEALLSVVSPTPRPSSLSSFTQGNIYTYVGNGSYGSSGIGGPATSASLNGPYYVAATTNGNMALADRNNFAIDFVPATSGTYFGQKMTASDIYRVAGNGTFGSSGIGGHATSASLNGPSSVAFDSFGNLYITDSDNSRIDMVPATSGTYFGQKMIAGDIYTIAGNGGFGYSGNGGPATSAQLDGPQGITVAPSGALFIADTNNDVVRMVPATSGTYFGQVMTAGDIYTIAGNGSYGSSGIGGHATSASLNGPSAVTTDTLGNLFFSDHDNNVVDMVPSVSGTYFGQQMTKGDIYRVAGNGSGGDTGNGGLAISASLNGPSGLAVDTNENLVIADFYDAQVQVVAGQTGTYFGQKMTTGDIYSIVGTGNPGYSGNGGSVTSAQVDGPSSVALDSFGDLFIADTNNDVVRLVGGSSSGPALNIPKGFSLFSSTSANGEETSVYLGSAASLISTNTGTIKITGSNTTNGSATLGVFSDVNTTDPVDAFSSASSLAQASTLSLPSLTTKYQGDLLLLSAGALIPTSSSGTTTEVSSWKLPSGLADISSTQPTSLSSSNSSFTDLLAQDPSNLPVGNTSPVTLSLSGASGLSGIELALRPDYQFLPAPPPMTQITNR